MVKYKTKDFKCENSTIIQKEMKNGLRVEIILL